MTAHRNVSTVVSLVERTYYSIVHNITDRYRCQIELGARREIGTWDQLEEMLTTELAEDALVTDFRLNRFVLLASKNGNAVENDGELLGRTEEGLDPFLRESALLALVYDVIDQMAEYDVQLQGKPHDH